MPLQEWGTKNLTASGEINIAGVAIRVKCIHIISTGGGGAVVSLKNNGTSGTTFVTQTGTVSTGATFYYGEDGFLFPNGCWAAFDGNTSSVLLCCRTI